MSTSSDDDDDERRHSSAGGRRVDDLSPRRLELLIMEVRSELAQLENMMENDRTSMRELVAAMPAIYVPRAEHEKQQQQKWQKPVIFATIFVAIVNPTLQVILFIASNHSGGK